MNPLPTRESFAVRLNTAFAMHADEAHGLALELIEVKDHKSSGGYVSFSLLFRAPLEAPPRQGSYRLEHETLPAMELFLVPVKRDDRGLYFEAVFNSPAARA